MSTDLEDLIEDGQMQENELAEEKLRREKNCRRTTRRMEEEYRTSQLKNFPG